MERPHSLPAASPPPVPAFVMFGLALAHLGINFVAPSASIAVGFVLVAVIIWLARVEYIPALIVTQLSSTDFLLEGYGTDSHMVANFEANALVIGGFSVTVTYALVVALMARVIWEAIRQPSFIPTRWGWWLAVLWATALPLSAWMCLQGMGEGNFSWTLPMRAGMMMAAFFYGLILARSFHPDSKLFEHWLLPMAIVFFVLASLAHFHHRVLWFLSGAVVPISFLTFRRRGLFFKLLGLAGVGACGFYALGFGKSVREEEVLGGLLGSGGSTFTLNALFAVSLILSFVVLVQTPAFRRLIAWFAGVPAFLFVVGFSILIAATATRMASVSVTGGEMESMSVVDRFQAKLFADRGVIWSATWNEITQPPYIIKPSGRPLLIDHPRWGVLPWMAGSHNSFLEQWRINGLYAGSVYLCFTLATMVGAGRVLRRGGFDALHVVAIIVLANVAVGATTGDYIATDSVAFFFFTFGGIAQSMTSLRAGETGRQAPVRRTSVRIFHQVAHR